MRRAKLVRRIVLVAFVVWLIFSGASFLLAYSDAKSGREALVSFRDDATAEKLKSGNADTQLRRASNLLGRSHDRLHNPIVRPFQWLPIAGRQIASADALTGAVATVGGVGLDALQSARQLTDGIKADRAGTLTKMAAIATAADARLNAVKLGPEDGLVKPLANARNETSTELAKLRLSASRAAGAANGLSDMFTSGGSYLVVAANNAEMRAGSGMFLSAGTLETTNGNVRLADMETIANTLGVADSKIQWSPDIKKLWGFMGKEADMRNLMLSPRFDQSAAVAKQIWRAAGRADVSGVIVIDPVFLQSMLRATGPVDVDGRSVTADSVITELLLEQYRSLPSTGSTTASQNARRELLSVIAQKSFDTLNGGGWDPIAMGRELGKAAEGRHILVWSDKPEVNNAWVSAGVGGTVDSHSLMLNMSNVGANKLDQFLQMSAEVSEVTGPSGLDMSVSVTIKNTVPESAPHYVLGPTPGTGLVAGEYEGMLSFTLPADASGMRFDGSVPTIAFGKDGPTQVIAGAVRVKRGESKTVVVRFTRSPTARFTVVEASARLPATKWSFGNESWSDEAPHIIRH